MEHPEKIERVILDGHSLTLEAFVAVARFGARWSCRSGPLEAMARSRAMAEKIAAEKRVAYGITTGFGDFATVAVSDEMSSRLSTNLILSHCTGTGEPYSAEQVRGHDGPAGQCPVRGAQRRAAPAGGDPGGDAHPGRDPGDPPEGLSGCLRGPGSPQPHGPGAAGQGGGPSTRAGGWPAARAMAMAGIQPLETLVCKEGLGITNAPAP